MRAATRERLYMVDREIARSAVAAAVRAAPAVAAEEHPPHDVSLHERPQLDIRRNLEDDRKRHAQVLGADFKLSSLNYRAALPGQGHQALHTDWSEPVSAGRVATLKR